MTWIGRPADASQGWEHTALRTPQARGPPDAQAQPCRTEGRSHGQAARIVAVGSGGRLMGVSNMGRKNQQAQKPQNPKAPKGGSKGGNTGGRTGKPK